MCYFSSNVSQYIIGVILVVVLIFKNISFDVTKEEKPQAIFLEWVSLFLD